MPSASLVHRIRTFVHPSGKRRKGKRTTVRTTAPVIPPRPTYPPKPARAPLPALTAPTPTVTRPVTVPVPAMPSVPTTRVVVRSDNPEMDRTIVYGTSWVPKTLMRPDDVRRLTPVSVPALGVPGMRLTVPQPVGDPVPGPPPSPRPSTTGRGSATATDTLERLEADTQDLIISDAWRDMFRTEAAHVCRDCHQWGPGVVTDDGRWVCGRCLSAGRY